MSEVNSERVIASHLKMLACAERLEQALARAPKPRDPRREAQPCEVFLDLPYTRDDCALMLRAIRAARKQHPFPKISGVHLPIEAVIQNVDSLEYRFQIHRGTSRHFGPQVDAVHRELGDLSKAFWKWYDAAGYGIPF